MKSHPNIAAISGTVHEILNLCVNKKEHSSDSWLPLLKKLRDTLEFSCEELDAYIPFKDEDYKLLKQKLTERFLQYRNDVNESTNAIESLKKQGKLIDRFDWLEDYIDNKEVLTSDDLYVVLFVLCDRFVERIKEDDYSEYYELSSLMGNNQSKVIGKSAFVKNSVPDIIEDPISDKQLAWACILEGNSFLDQDALNKKFNRTGESLYNRLCLIRQVDTEIKNGFKPRLSRRHIIKDMNRCIKYFETLGDDASKLKAINFREKIQKDLNEERKENDH